MALEKKERRGRRVGDESLGYDNPVHKMDVEFLNPYPWMSATEARVHLELERRQVPFTWRFFDGDLAPHLAMLMPSYAPEFTLKEYRTVIIVQGGYFSTIPGVLDKVALATVLLEADGWTVVVLFEQDILRDIRGTLTQALPWMRDPPIKGDPRNPPLGTPDFMFQRRINLRAFNIRKAKYALDPKEQSNVGRTGSTGRRRRRLRRQRAGRTRNRESS